MGRHTIAMARADSLHSLRLAVSLAWAIVACLLTPLCARAEQNLLLNGDFATGSGAQPDDWRIEAWINAPDAFKCSWKRPESGHPGELEVENFKANDGRWMESVTLEPGWYQLSVEVRSENVGSGETGATISVMEDGIMSRDIRGTADWQKVALYLKVSGEGADVEVAVRVGGFSSLNTGRAFFRNARLVKIAAPSPGATPTYDLAELRKQSAPEPLGSPYSLVIVFALLAAAAIYGWRLFGAEEAPEQRAEVPRKEQGRAARR